MFGALAGNAGTVQLLLEKGAFSVNERAGDGFTPLMGAVSGGNPAIVRALLARGAEPTATTDNGFTALMTVSAKTTPEIASLLIERGVAVNARNSRGATALMLAAARGNAPSCGACWSMEPTSMPTAGRAGPP